MKPSRSILSAAFALAGAGFGAAAANAATMTFRTLAVGQNCGARCPQMIVAEGEITTDTPAHFVAFVRRQAVDPNTRGVILLHSHGGRVGAAMELGKLFRQAGAAVIVGRASSGAITAGACYSACVYALIGAKKRVIPRVSRIGVHRMVAFDRAGADPEQLPSYQPVHATPDLVKRLSDYAGSMGVSRELINVAERVRHDRLRMVTASEIRRWKLGSEKF